MIKLLVGIIIGVCIGVAGCFIYVAWHFRNFMG
jgi:hypothetical protein